MLCASSAGVNLTVDKGSSEGGREWREEGIRLCHIKEETHFREVGNSGRRRQMAVWRRTPATSIDKVCTTKEIQLLNLIFYTTSLFSHLPNHLLPSRVFGAYIYHRQDTPSCSPCRSVGLDMMELKSQWHALPSLTIPCRCLPCTKLPSAHIQ